MTPAQDGRLPMSAVSLLNTRLEALRASFLARDHKLFVDGHWVAAQSGQSFDVLDPATGERLRRAGARPGTGPRARRPGSLPTSPAWSRPRAKRSSPAPGHA